MKEYVTFLNKNTVLNSNFSLTVPTFQKMGAICTEMGNSRLEFVGDLNLDPYPDHQDFYRRA